MSKLKVEGYASLVRDTRSNGIINTNQSEYKMYMARVRAREENGDQISSSVTEITNLKSELREIQSLLKEVVKK